MTAQLTLVLVSIFLVPVFALTIQHSQSRIEVTKREISSSALRQLRTSESVWELIHAEVQRNAFVLSLDQNLNMLSEEKTLRGLTADGDVWSTVYTLSKTVDSLQYSNDRYHSIAIVLADADYVILSKTGVILKEDYVDDGYAEAYEAYLRNRTTLNFLPARYVKTQLTSYRQPASELTQPENYVITFLYPLTLYSTRVTGVIIINVMETEVMSLLSAAHDEQRLGMRTVVLDTEQNVLLDANVENLGKPFSGALLEKMAQSPSEGSFTAGFEGEQTLVSYYVSTQSGLTFVSLYPLKALTDALQTITLTSVLTTAMWVLLGIAVSTFLASRISRPVRALVSTIRDQSGETAKGHELDILSQAFSTLSEHESRLYESLEQNRDNIRVGSLIALLRGQTPDAEPEAGNLIRFPHPYYACCVLCVDHADQVIQFALHERLEPLSLAVELLCGRAGEALAIETLLPSRAELIILLNGEGPLPKLAEAIGALMMDTIRALTDATGLSFSAGVGELRADRKALPASLKEAREALEYKLVQGLGNVLFYADYADRQPGFYDPHTYVNRIFSLLRAGNSAELADAVHALIQDIKRHDRLHHENIQAILHQVFSDIMRYIMESNRLASDVFANSAQLSRQLHSLETLDEVDRWMTQVVLQIADSLRPPDGGEEELSGRILKYLDDHCHEELDLTAVAERFGISYSHLRRVFSRATNDTILNYVNNRRIQDAKRLLIETDIAIGELSRKLGYVNKQSFYRFFKRSEGVTPSEYRSIHQGK